MPQSNSACNRETCVHVYRIIMHNNSQAKVYPEVLSECGLFDMSVAMFQIHGNPNLPHTRLRGMKESSSLSTNVDYTIVQMQKHVLPPPGYLPTALL